MWTEPRTKKARQVMMQLATPHLWVQEVWSYDRKKTGFGHISPVLGHVRGSLALAVGGQGAPGRKLAAAKSQASLRGTWG